jgi:hypothetical protein
MPKGKTGDTEFYIINKTYKIDSDKTHNFILKRKGANEEGEEDKTWKTIGYFPTVKQVYHAVVELGIKESSLIDLKVLNEKVNELHALIEDARSIMGKSLG